MEANPHHILKKDSDTLRGYTIKSGDLETKINSNFCRDRGALIDILFKATKPITRAISNKTTCCDKKVCTVIRVIDIQFDPARGSHWKAELN
ncbi:hypothetical protein K2173_007011 [Erythroxylum novogranatense]|uniref:Uncharacterized protein n=1 Tax=Erythroxylum novogranatense TaxID=1862640 RepID=A0AAV8SL25_9ROSI|nr:hypothetical protein K2173_007011 [Erythroxylum novogranatense]